MTAALAAALAATPLFASGEDEGAGDGSGGAMMALEAVGGTPYVDYYWSTASAYMAETGNSITALGESPVLAARVAGGELPAVVDRLPADPAVIRPPFEIGQYSGRFRWHGVAVQNEPGMMIEGASQPLGKLTPDGSRIHPNVVADWSVSDDKHTLTINLRPGQKWPDGEAFDADDFVWPSLGRTRSRSRNWCCCATGRSTPSTTCRSSTSTTTKTPTHSPRKPAARVGRRRSASAPPSVDGPGSRPTVMSANDIGMPSMDPWIIAEDGLDSELWARNPFYWRIDTAGNQLPYLDEVLVTFLSNAAEQLPVKVMAGELDLATGLSLADAEARAGCWGCSAPGCGCTAWIARRAFSCSAPTRSGAMCGHAPRAGRASRFPLAWWAWRSRSRWG